MSQNAQCETRITDLTPGIWAGMYDIICSLNYSQLIKLEPETEPQAQKQWCKLGDEEGGGGELEGGGERHYHDKP